MQELEDGSKFALTRFSYNNTNLFTHGTWLERCLGSVIPTNGVKLGLFHLRHRTLEQFPWDDGHGLIIEFKRLSTNAPGQMPLASRPPRFVRCVIVGDDGSEYLAEFHDFGMWAAYNVLSEFLDDSSHPITSKDFFNSSIPGRRSMMTYPEGQFEYFTSRTFPRASKRLTVRLEANDSSSPTVPDGKWKPFANFKINNPAFMQPNPWRASPLPITNRVAKFDFVLGDLNVHPNRYHDSLSTERELSIWMQARGSNGVDSRFRVVSIKIEDALGGVRERGRPFHFDRGWLIQNDRVMLEPRNAWKVSLDFVRIADLESQPLAFGGDWNTICTTGLEPESVCMVRVPRGTGATLLTNLHGLPMRIIQWGSSGGGGNGRNYLGYKIQITEPHPELRVLDLGAGQRMLESEPLLPMNAATPAYVSVYDTGAAELELTFALVKNYHVEFIVQPRLLDKVPPNATTVAMAASLPEEPDWTDLLSLA